MDEHTKQYVRDFFKGATIDGSDVEELLFHDDVVGDDCIDIGLVAKHWESPYEYHPTVVTLTLPLDWTPPPLPGPRQYILNDEEFELLFTLLEESREHHDTQDGGEEVAIKIAALENEMLWQQKYSERRPVQR